VIPSGKPYLSRLVVDTMFDVSSFQDNGLVDTINVSQFQDNGLVDTISSHKFKIMDYPRSSFKTSDGNHIMGVAAKIWFVCGGFFIPPKGGRR
jgi:hypothetical protein